MTLMRPTPHEPQLTHLTHGCESSFLGAAPLRAPIPLRAGPATEPLDPGYPWTPLAASPSLLSPGTRIRQPRLVRAAAQDWPAVSRWQFSKLAALARTIPELPPVQLVRGNREYGATRFETAPLDQYLDQLDHPCPDQTEPMAALKEFDLLRTFPQLKSDLRPHTLFARRDVVSSHVWMGPAQARTGLHFDLLDNIAVMLRGRKRFYLAPPGAVEQLEEVSDKYDRWAVLSRISAATLGRHWLQPVEEERQATTPQLYVVDLEPGDVLYVPSGWWHEVVNLSPSLLLSGFHGPLWRALGQWLRTGLWQGLHNAGLWRPGHCTCHPSTDDAAAAAHAHAHAEH